MDYLTRFLDRLPWFVQPSHLGVYRSLIVGIALGMSLSTALGGLSKILALALRRRPALTYVNDVEGLIGDTPLIKIQSLSKLTGVTILGKCEYLNPFGSVKDRVSLRMIQDAEKRGLISPNSGCCLFEGTSGSTGISLAGIARARGYQCHITLPNDVSREKVQQLEGLGATVERVPPVSIVDKNHYVNLAKTRAKEYSLSSDKAGNGFFCDQFENLANFRAHFEWTGPELWRQTHGHIDVFVSGSGTGGTLAGVGSYLKKKKKSIKIILADPNGSGLYHKIKNGAMYAETEREGTRRRYQIDTVVEGIGLNRLTKNFAQAIPYIDDAIRVTDSQAAVMSRHVAQHDGIFVGSSSAVNLVTAFKIAEELKEEFGPERAKKMTIVTILCDSGTRHFSRFWNDEFLENQMDIDPKKELNEVLEL